MRNLLLLPLLLSLLAPLNPVLAQKKAKSPAPAAAPEPADTTRHRTITGIVLDERTKQGIPGVTVLIKGTQQGTATDHNGQYSL